MSINRPTRPSQASGSQSFSAVRNVLRRLPLTMSRGNRPRGGSTSSECSTTEPNVATTPTNRALFVSRLSALRRDCRIPEYDLHDQAFNDLKFLRGLEQLAKELWP